MATSKILVIDDSRVIRKTVRDMLPDGDFEVIEAKDGLEGIEYVQRELPSLIMLDFILPKLSGWDVFQQIQSHPDFQKIPLVLMSGKKEEVTSKISEPFEFFEFIEKPFDKAILAEAIRTAMTKARKARPRVAELPGSTPVVADAPVMNEDLLAEIQARLDSSEERMASLQSANSAEIQELKAKLAEMERGNRELSARSAAAIDGKEAADRKIIQLETEVDTLKKQLGQLVVLIKKKFAS